MTSETLQARLRDGIAAALRVDRDKAQLLLRDVVARDPHNEQAWLWLAAAAATTDEAIYCLRRVTGISPDHPHARAALGQALLGQGFALAGGDPEAARLVLAEAAQLLPNHAEVWITRADLAADDAERRMHLRQALAARRGDRATERRVWARLVARGGDLLKLGHRADALEMFKEASALAPEDARTWFALAQLSATPASAIEPLRRAIQLDPTHQKARLCLAAILEEMARAAEAAGDKDEVQSLLSEACALYRASADSWMDRPGAEEEAGELRIHTRVEAG